MNVCFLLQRNFSYIGHSLALWLKEKYGMEQFCGYVQVRAGYEFLRSQKDISYRTLVLDEDVHARYKDEKLDMDFLRAFEREYGTPTLWPYLSIDRIIMFQQLVREYPWNTPKYTHEEMLRILQVNIKAVLSFLETEKPDVIVLSVNCSLPSMLLTKIAEKKGIKTLYILATSLKETFVISEAFDRFTDVERLFRATLADGKKDASYHKARAFLADFRKAPAPFDSVRTPEEQPVNRRKQLSFLWPGNFIRSLGWFCRMLYRHMTRKERHDYSYIHPWYFFKDHLTRKVRNLYGVADLYDRFDEAGDYVFFGLHLEPEMALLLHAPFATDQLHLIRQTAKALPVGCMLYVKEHPQMVSYRPRSFYAELKKIPNVRLIDPSIMGLTLIEKARLVFTVSGSIGLEALLLGKPVIVFGDQFYNTLSMVKKCSDMSHLPYVVQEQLEKFHFNEEELLHFIAAIYTEAATLPFFHIWEQEFDAAKRKAALEPLADVLAKKLRATQDITSPSSAG